MDRTDELRDDPYNEQNRDDHPAPEPEDTTRRRRRDEELAGSREVQQTPGATGVDMGGGGTGTDIDRDI